MFEPLDKGEEGKDRSLLTLGRALQEERARVEARDAAAGGPAPDAATRHRQARARREALSGPLMSTPGTPETRRAADETGSWFDDVAAHPRGDREPSAPSNEAAPVEPNPPRQAAAAPAAPAPTPPERTVIVEDRWRQDSRADGQDIIARRADDRWQPLIDPQLVIGRIAGSKALIATTTLAGALLGVAIALSTPKQYEALTEVMIYPRDLKIVEREITTADLPSDAMLGIIENNARILTSGPVLAKVVAQLNLVNDPEFNGTGGSNLSNLLNPIAFVRSLLSRTDGPDNSRLEGTAVAALADKISVDRTGKTFILNVNVATEDAEKSALIANALVAEFIKYTGQLQSETAGRATTELTSRLEEMRKNLEAAEDKVEAFKTENDIIDPQGRSIADEELIKLNDQLSIARARTLELDSKAASARQLDVNSVVSGSLPEGTSSGVLTELRSQYASVKQSVDNAAVRLGPRHPQRQALEAQLAGARDQISGELRRIVSSMQVELKRAVELEQDLAARLAQLKVRRGSTNQDMVKLRELERDVNSKRSVYESYLLRARETGEQKDLNTANISIVSPANAPLDPTGPSRAMIAATGTILGFLAGIGLAGGRGAVDSLRASGEARRRRRLSDSGDEGRPVRAVAAPNPAPPRAAAPVPTSEESETYTRSDQPRVSQPAHLAYGHQQTAPSHMQGALQMPENQAANYDHGYQQPAAEPAHPPQQPAYPQQADWRQSAPEPAWPSHLPPQWGAPPASAHAHPAYPLPAAAPAYRQPPLPQQSYYYSQPVAPPQPVPSTPQTDPALYSSIDELRATVRECRDAVRQLADKHARRFF